MPDLYQFPKGRKKAGLALEPFSNDECSGLEKLQNGKNWRICFKTGQLEVLSVHDLLPLPATARELT